MAQLIIEQDPFQPGCWTLRSADPRVLAAVPDALVQVLDLAGDALAAWALHPDEQAGLRDAAYHEELRELGPGAVADVVELVRPWQQNVVWVDRYHLVVDAARPAVGSRLLGLYVGSTGRIVIAVHHPSVAAIVQQQVGRLPHDNGRDWDSAPLLGNCRFVVHSTAERPGVLDLRAPQPMAVGVQGALERLVGMVAGW